MAQAQKPKKKQASRKPAPKQNNKIQPINQKKNSGKPKFKQTHKAKMARRRTVTVCIALLLLIAIIVGAVSCVSSKKQKAAEEAAAQKASTSAESKTDALDTYISKMTLDQKILQMMIVTPETLTGASVVTEAGSTTQSALNSYPVGGVYFSASNMTSKEQFKEMVSGYQSYIQASVGIPMFIAVAEEGGDTAPCATNLGTTAMESAYSYADNENPTTDLMADTASVASSLAYVGVNLNLAPYTDTGVSSQTSTSTRSFGTDYETVGNMVSAAVTGYKNGGVGSVLKYFPCVGETISDGSTSTLLPSTTKTLEELEAQDIVPFSSGVTAGATAIMVAHISINDVEEGVPASLSKKVIQNVIREGMQYNGLIMTSALSDNVIANNYTPATAAVASVEAGNDIIFLPTTISGTLTAIKDAVTAGTITEEQINTSVKRILQAKIDLNIMSLQDDGTLVPVTTTNPATELASDASGVASTATAVATSVATSSSVGTTSASTTASVNTTVAVN